MSHDIFFMTFFPKKNPRLSGWGLGSGVYEIGKPIRKRLHWVLQNPRSSTGFSEEPCETICGWVSRFHLFKAHVAQTQEPSPQHFYFLGVRTGFLPKKCQVWIDFPTALSRPPWVPRSPGQWIRCVENKYYPSRRYGVRLDAILKKPSICTTSPEEGPQTTFFLGSSSGYVVQIDFFQNGVQSHAVASRWIVFVLYTPNPLSW